MKTRKNIEDVSIVYRCLS